MNVFSGMLLFFAACKCCCFNVALEPKSAWSHKAYQKCHRNCSETSRNISQIGYIPCLTREKLVQLVGTCKTSSCGSVCRSGLLPQCHGAAWRCMRCMHCMPRVQRCPGGPVVPRCPKDPTRSSSGWSTFMYSFRSCRISALVLTCWT